MKYLLNVRNILLVFMMSFLIGNLSAQNSKLVNISYDPKSDSVFFARMHKYMAGIRKTRPTVALVLAGGGAKGAAHIGVLKYLEEKGIPVDFVAGTSMGGLMGGLYAMGYSATEIDSIVQAVDWNVMMSDNVPKTYYSYEKQLHKQTYVIDIPFKGKEFVRSLPSGFLYGLNVYNMMSSLSVGYQHDMDFMDLPTPYCCVATEIVSQTEKHWTSGPLIEAMRSTMSIPGYFRPVRVDSMILVDGGTKNNFPTDVAKAAGADIIIGVELTMPRDYGKVNNVADVIMQTAQYSGGLEAHNNNVKNTTVYITPDITGFGMLSFGTKEIATLIERGYKAAAEHERELDSLVRIVGNNGRKMYNKKAVNLSNTEVKITSVEYTGVTEKEQDFLNWKIRLKADEYYGKEQLEIAQSVIYGMMAFSQVTYRLVSDGSDGYKLIFNCLKKHENSIGIGLRADTEEWFAALLNFGFGRNRIYGSEFDLILRLSTSPYLKLEYSFTPIRAPKFGASLKIHYRTLFGNGLFRDPKDVYIEQLVHNELKVYIADTHWSRVDLSGGFRLEHQPYWRYFSSEGVSSGVNWKQFYPFVYLRFLFDNEDDRYFPNKGIRVSAAYDFDFKDKHYVSFAFKGTIPTCKIFSIIASVRGRYVLGGVAAYQYMYNYIGGTMEGRYYEHQMPFIGYNGGLMCGDILTTVDLDFRFKVYKNIYVSAIAAALHDGNVNDKKLVMQNHAIFAAALQFAYKSKFGPLMANVHWNSKQNRVGFYIGVGYDF